MVEEACPESIGRGPNRPAIDFQSSVMLKNLRPILRAVIPLDDGIRIPVWAKNGRYIALKAVLITINMEEIPS
jgi:hypothetical protein